MNGRNQLSGNRLLLMGSKAFKAAGLPVEVSEKVDEAIARCMIIIVGEAPGASRLFQDYLKSKGYANAIVGHAKSIRYNAGNWKTVQYGNDLKERERRMIEDCDSAIVIWTDASGVIAENLELLKRLDKPTFIYECTSGGNTAKAGWLDPARTYDPYYAMNEFYMNRKRQEQETRDSNSHFG